MNVLLVLHLVMPLGINHVRLSIGVSFSDGGAVISGVVTATSFVGDGSALTGVTASANVTSNAENTIRYRCRSKFQWHKC